MTRAQKIRLNGISISLVCLLLTVQPTLSQEKTTDAFEQNKKLGRGGNFGNILYQWDDWNKERDRDDMDKMREVGMKGIRINTRPFLHMNQEPGYNLSREAAHGRVIDILLEKEPPYVLSEEFFERLDWTVNEALKRGFTVIIDNHQYRVMGQDPMGLRDMFLASWQQMADHYKDYPANVYFGILNEPNRNLTPYLWNYFMMDAYEIIRESNPNRTLVTGPGKWNGIDALDELELPEEDRNIIVEVHYYSPHSFTHQGIAGRETNVTWEGTPEQKQAVEEDFEKAVEWAEKHNRPLYLGEYGVIHTADRQSAEKWLGFVVSQMEKHGMSWAMWDLMGSHMGAFDEEKREWIEYRKNAILPPYD